METSGEEDLRKLRIIECWWGLEKGKREQKSGTVKKKKAPKKNDSRDSTGEH